MKKIDMTQVLKTMGGIPLKQTELLGMDKHGREIRKETEEPVTLGAVCVNALLDPRNDDPKTTGEIKLARFLLAQSIYQAKVSQEPIEIGNSDIAMIKKLVSNVFPSLVVGQTYLLLDQKESGQ